MNLPQAKTIHKMGSVANEQYYVSPLVFVVINSHDNFKT